MKLSDTRWLVFKAAVHTALKQWEPSNELCVILRITLYRSQLSIYKQPKSEVANIKRTAELNVYLGDDHLTLL